MKLALTVLLAALACKDTERAEERAPTRSVDVTTLATERAKQTLDQGTVSIVVPRR